MFISLTAALQCQVTTLKAAGTDGQTVGLIRGARPTTRSREGQVFVRTLALDDCIDTILMTMLVTQGQTSSSSWGRKGEWHDRRMAAWCILTIITAL